MLISVDVNILHGVIVNFVNKISDKPMRRVMEKGMSWYVEANSYQSKNG